MQDVARRAGVSIKTVSNVMNGYRYISPATKAKVEAAIEELGYRLNVTARNLRSRRTGMIGLAVTLAYLGRIGPGAHRVEIGQSAPETSLLGQDADRGGAGPGVGRGELGRLASGRAPVIFFFVLSACVLTLSPLRPGAPCCSRRRSAS